MEFKDIDFKELKSENDIIIVDCAKLNKHL